MDEQVDRKKEIANAIAKRASENTTSQAYLLDMSQEVNRCNHIMQHILRSQYNYEGRLVGSAMLGTAALLFTLDQTSSLKKVGARNIGMIAGATLAFSIFGFYYFGARRFGAVHDYRKNQAIYDKSLSYDKEISATMKNFKA